MKKSSANKSSALPKDVLYFGLHPYAHDGVDFMVVSLSINSETLADFSYYAIDLEELVRSQSEDGEVFLLTCWCGQPSCAGIYRGVQVWHEAADIHWLVPEPDAPKEYVFEKAALETALSVLRKEIRGFVAERIYTNKAPYKIVPMQNEPFFNLE